MAIEITASELEKYEAGVSVEMRQKIWFDVTLDVMVQSRAYSLEEQIKQIRRQYVTVLKIHYDNRDMLLGLARGSSFSIAGGRG